MSSEKRRWWQDVPWVILLIFLAASLTLPIVLFGPWNGDN